LTTEDDKHTDILIFLVDDDKYYPVATRSNIGCGGKQLVNRSFVIMNELKDVLDEVPSEDTKFVVVGPYRPKIKDIKFFYPDDSPHLFK